MRGYRRGTNIKELGVERRDSSGQLADRDFVNVDRGGKVDSFITWPLQYNNMYASGELSADGVKMSDVTYNNPELDLLPRMWEAHEFPTAYDNGAHDRHAVGSEISVLNSVTGRRTTGVEGDGEGFVLFVHGRIPLGGVLVRENGDQASTIHQGRIDRQSGVSGGLISLDGLVKRHLVYAVSGGIEGWGRCRLHLR